MRKLLRRGAAAVTAVASLALLSLGAAPAQAAPTANHPGMTWTLLDGGTGNGVVRVGADATTNAYNGDTPATATRPVLCLRVNNSAVPAGVSPDFYAGWARGTVALTPPVQGTALTSLSAANALCAQYYGTGWRMAEFHDGRYGSNLELTGGWSYWAYGYVPANTRFWVHINDQLANPWN